MPKGIRKIDMDEEQIQRLFLDLTKLEPPKKPTVKEVLDTYKGNIETAIKRGNSLRDISKFLTDGGMKVSHETLRKLAEEWGFSANKQKSVQKNSVQKSVKNSTENNPLKTVELGENILGKTADMSTKKQAKKDKEKVEKKGTFTVVPDRVEY